MTRTVHTTVQARPLRHADSHVTANVDDVDDASDVDEETYGNISKDIDRAERDGHDQGKPGSFLNKLILRWV